MTKLPSEQHQENVGLIQKLLELARGGLSLVFDKNEGVYHAYQGDKHVKDFNPKTGDVKDR